MPDVASPREGGGELPWEGGAMLMPVLSVTAIGVVVAVVGIIRGRPAGAMLLRGILGAWLGFVAGAVPGVVLDVVLANGVYVALLGHLGAAAGAAVAVSRGPTAAAVRRRANSQPHP